MRVTAKDIKEFLRENGINTKDIRVSTANSINVKLLDPKLDFDKIETLLAQKYESYQRDEGQSLEYNKRVVKRAIQECLYLFLRSNPEEIKGLTVEGWN